ncbi:MAG: LysM peptidoglycan-binding domain-containing protein [Bacillota bacterium]
MQYRLLLLLLATLLTISPAWAASYTVLPGDSLYKIGQKFGTSAEAIQQANGLKTTVIYPGQVLNIPNGGNLYTVQPGDSLYKIARRYGLSYQELMEFNGLGSDAIYPGQVLRIPDGGNLYTVQPGDSLYKIASGYGITYQDLMRFNDLTSERIHPGQVLRIPTSSTNVSRGDISRADFDLLARLVTAEAGSEPYIAKVGVGAVILNRVKDPRFPNTIPGVIYQKYGGYYQFEPVANGWINRPASADSVRAAGDALSGWDPTKGALYFYSSGATNKFVLSLPVACVLGGITFCYAK